MEDDPAITGVLERHLTKWGFAPYSVTDFSAVLEEFIHIEPHLVLLDISLPYFNGYYWCGELRRISKTPVIFLSSAGDQLNQVMALNMGADDFISKPFDLEVLVAKMQALLRRTYDFGGQMHVLEHRGAVLNLNDASLLVGEVRLDLTKNEFRILQFLLENKGRTVSRSAMMERLWENDSFIDDNTLTVNIARLRRRLEEAGLSAFIVTKKGLGYLVE